MPGDVLLIDFASGEVLNFGLKVRSSLILTLRMGVYWIYRLPECLNKSCNWYYIYLFVIEVLKNRMVNMLLYETKLPFAYPCRSTWPHCNTVYCRWGRYNTTEITNTKVIAATRVSQDSHTLYKTKVNGLSMEKQGNLRKFTKQLREFLKIAKSQAILREWLWQI